MKDECAGAARAKARPVCSIPFFALSILLFSAPAFPAFAGGTARIPAALLHVDTFTSICIDGVPENSEKLQVSLGRLKAGGVFLVGAAIWVPPSKAKTPGRALEYVEKVAACIRGFAAGRPDEAVIAVDSSAALKAQSDGKVAIFISVEGGDAILAGDDAMERIYAAGVRSISLTWSRSNALAASSGGGNDYGLSAQGRAAVAAMNKMGIMVDVSHASDRTLDDILKFASAPVFASHSDCRSIAGGRRNLDDPRIAEIARAGGVVGLSFHAAHLTGRKTATIGDAVLHAACVRDAGGASSVALGSDYDGRIDAAKGLEDASRIQDFRGVLKEKGFSDKEIEGVFFNNFIRFWKSVEGVAHGKAQ